MKTVKTKLLQTVPLWLAITAAIDLSIVVGASEFFWLQKNYQHRLEIIQLSSNPQALVDELTQKVLPADGYQTNLSWSDLGKKLVAVGAIDLDKAGDVFSGLNIFTASSDEKIKVSEANARGMVNTLWALGLTNQSRLLTQGEMVTSGIPTANFAATGGWTLGQKEAMALYASQKLIPLTDDQEDLVAKIAASVFRPCCNNPTSFPDCNHGMAALGYIELAVSQGLSETQIYQDLLAFNSFWFPQTYVEMAVYFNKNQGLNWDQVDPKTALSFAYSSAQGTGQIHDQVQSVPGLTSQEGSCGA